MSSRRPFLPMSRLTARFALVLALAASPVSVTAATPPAQPKEGPGGSNYVASEVAKRAIGNASATSFVFHAAGPAASPRPVVVLLHAWGVASTPLLSVGQDFITADSTER